MRFTQEGYIQQPGVRMPRFEILRGLWRPQPDVKDKACLAIHPSRIWHKAYISLDLRKDTEYDARIWTCMNRL